MKKLILSLFLSIIGFIGFSNAVIYEGIIDENGNFNDGVGYAYEENSYFNLLSVNSPCYPTYSLNYELYYNDEWGDYIPLIVGSNLFLDSVGDFYIYFDGDPGMDGFNCAGTYRLYYGSDPYTNSVIPDNPSEGGNGGNIVPDGSLLAVITGVFRVFGELIPYVVYIGIGILIVTIGFYAIRRLVNWLSDKIHNNFKF